MRRPHTSAVTFVAQPEPSFLERVEVAVDRAPVDAVLVRELVDVAAVATV
jgi:hypothetical protein